MPEIVSLRRLRVLVVVASAVLVPAVCGGASDSGDMAEGGSGTVTAAELPRSTQRT